MAITKSVKKNILITGAHGFLGRHVAKYFKEQGYTVTGIGHGYFSDQEATQVGIDTWHALEISTQNLKNLAISFDVIVHCAGGSKVVSSLENPANDFNSTVAITLEVLEFIRCYSPKTLLIYPSSAAVYGEHDDSKIGIEDPLQPASPYGVHKKMAEQLCLSYHQFFQVQVCIIRFFSIYGPGLKKQLIWDACKKISADQTTLQTTLQFWGTGTETRDWIYISDAVNLIYRFAENKCAENNSMPLIVNGGCGVGVTIKDTLTLLAQHFSMANLNIEFNGAVKAGDPRHYCADIDNLSTLPWQPKVTLDIGLRQYVSWFKSCSHD